MKHLYYTHAGGFLPVFVYTVCGNEICQVIEIEVYPDSDEPDDPEVTIEAWLADVTAGNEERPPELNEVDLEDGVIIHEL